MATTEQIIARVRDEIDAKEYSVNRILDLFNDCLISVAAGRFSEAPDLNEIFLPALETSSTVDTSTSLPYVSLPENYQKSLLSCYNETTDSDVSILPSLTTLDAMFPGLEETYSVEYVAVAGLNLYYQGMPDTSQNLTIRYFRKPTTLVIGAEPDCLPAHLQIPVLKNYALWNMYLKKEYMLPQKANADYYKAAFIADLADLALICNDSRPYTKRPIRIKSVSPIKMIA